MFTACNVLDIEYEGINENFDLVMEQIASFLGFEMKPYEVRFKKATPDDLSAAVLNYGEIKEYFNEAGMEI